jgi:hypothetical protein
LNNAGTVAFTVTTRLAHLELQSAMRSALIVLPGSGSVAEDLVVRSSADGGYVCLLIDGTLRDSACLAGGVGSRAVGSNPSGALTPKLRNVTAISSGSGGAGVSFDLVAGGSSSLAASVKSTIARATGSGGIDVKASESGGNTSIAIDHSNYVTTDDQSGAAPITDAGGHQTGAPALAADGYHELPSSNSTIDLGATDASSGSADIDGQFRSIERGCDPFGCPGGPHTDIGADELGRPTSLSVTCTPASLMLGSGISSCYVLARDIGNPSLFTGSPGGAVTYSSSGAGTFGAPFGPATCQLEAIGIGSQDSECTVAYTPSAGGTHQVTGVYTPDDRTHEPSQASAEIAVITPAAASTTAAAAAKKCKKGRKLVKRKGKKRCVKKKKRR